MKKFFIITFIFILFYGLKSFSYEAFSGKYNYQDITQNIGYEDISKNEEVLFIVDFSGSMNASIENNSRKNHALNAIKYILDKADASTKIGLRIFGATAFERSGRKYQYNADKLCEASMLVIPVAKYNSSNIIDKVQKTTPIGLTPIKYSLQQAVQNDFSNDDKVKKHIILVTDGYENCGGDPCEYISNLMQMRNDYKVDVIGITVEGNAYSQLSCIAGAGNGRYYPVNTPEDFKLRFIEAFSSKPPLPQNEPDVKINTQKQTPKNNDIEYKNFIFSFDY